MDISTIIIKKLKGNLTLTEEELFSEWLNKSEENRETFHRLKAHMKEGGNLFEFSDINPENAWILVMQKVQMQKKQDNFFNNISYLRYAAVVLLLLSFGYGYWTFNSNSSEEIQIDSNAITLQLGNGEVKVLSTEQFADITDTEGNVLGAHKGSQLDYSESSKHQELIYNTLTVPYGKRFDIVLSDESIVYLNAGSSIKYPVNFLEGMDRKVFLEGEAFFDINEDRDRPFIVTANNMNVRVLGTEFNIASYPEDPHINTVLVEGSVSLYGTSKDFKDDTALKLEPGFKASWEKTKEKIELKKVNTDIYTGWLKGKLVLKRMPFRDIIKKFQRHYNVTISNNYKALDDRVFTATFDVESIEEALDVFVEDTFFEYRLEGRNVIINQPKQTNP